jgi:hypothetical protein
VEAATVADGVGRTEAVVAGLVESYTSPLFKAALQVWTHAAADPALREHIVPLEAKFGRVSHRRAVAALGVDDSDPVAHHLVQATLDLARGLGLADVLTDDSARRKEIVQQWAATLHAALNAPLCLEVPLIDRVRRGSDHGTDDSDDDRSGDRADDEEGQAHDSADGGAQQPAQRSPEFDGVAGRQA